MQNIVLQAKGVTKRFGGITALENAELEVREGEVHALVGANGAGKSTLIKSLQGHTQTTRVMFILMERSKY